jgi:hypothetical protein
MLPTNKKEIFVWVPDAGWCIDRPRSEHSIQKHHDVFFDCGQRVWLTSWVSGLCRDSAL